MHQTGNSDGEPKTRAGKEGVEKGQLDCLEKEKEDKED